MTEFHATTICAVKKDGKTAIAGDGQVTMGESVIFKNSAQKVRRIYGGKVILGFAGSVSDAFSLSEKFEGMLNKFYDYDSPGSCMCLLLYGVFGYMYG